MKNKVAEITLYFWLLKIIATTLGETAGDMFSMTMGMGYTASFILTVYFIGFIIFSNCLT